MSHKVTVNGKELSLKFSRYHNNGRLVMMLMDLDDPLEFYYIASVNLPDCKLGSNEILIKDYSENVGVLEGLEAAGIVEHTGRSINSGFVQIPICRLLVEEDI